MEAKTFIKLLSLKDNRAYKELFRQYYAPMKNLAMTYLKNEYAAEDVVQDIFLALYRHAGTFDSMDGLRFYLYKALRNNNRVYTVGINRN